MIPRPLGSGLVIFFLLFCLSPYISSKFGVSASYPNVQISDGYNCPGCAIGERCCISLLNPSVYTCMPGSWNSTLCCTSGAVCGVKLCVDIQNENLNRTFACCDWVPETNTTKQVGSFCISDLSPARCFAEDGCQKTRIPLTGNITVCVIFFVLQLVNAVLLILRGKFQPLKARKTVILMTSLVASTVVGLYITVIMPYVPCPVSLLVLMISAPILFTAFIYRALNIFFMHKHNALKPLLANNQLENNGKQYFNNLGSSLEANSSAAATDEEDAFDMPKEASVKRYRLFKFFVSTKFFVMVLVCVSVISLLLWVTEMSVHGEDVIERAWVWVDYPCEPTSSVMVMIAVISFIQFIVLAVFGVLIRRVEEAFSMTKEILIDVVISAISLSIILAAYLDDAFFTRLLSSGIGNGGFFIYFWFIAIQLNNITVPAIKTFIWERKNDKGDKPSTKRSDKEQTNAANLKSIEEVEAYFEKVERVIEHKTAMKFFTKYMNKEFSTENAFVWEAIKQYQGEPDVDKRKQIAQSVYNTYIKVSAEIELNINPERRRQIADQYLEAPVTLFDELKHDVLLMLKDTFTRFIESAEWKQMVEEARHLQNF